MTFRCSVWTALILLSCSAGGVRAALAQEEELRSEVQALMTRLASSGAFVGDGAGTGSLTVSAPAEAVVPLGLVLDTAAAPGRGLRVVAVTPGQNGTALGLLAGDLIVAVNGQDLSGRAGLEAAALLRSEAARAPYRLSLSLRRADQNLVVEGALRAVQLPAFRLEVGSGLAGLGAGITGTAMAALAAPVGTNCGRLSQDEIPPRVRGLYPVHVVSIDGRVPGTHGQEAFRLDPGVHRVTVAENIDWRELPSTFALTRRQFGERSFEVTVRPGITGMLAAQLLLTQPGAMHPREHYWQPVVWRELAEPCR